MFCCEPIASVCINVWDCHGQSCDPNKLWDYLGHPNKSHRLATLECVVPRSARAKAMASARAKARAKARVKARARTSPSTS